MGPQSLMVKYKVLRSTTVFYSPTAKLLFVQLQSVKAQPQSYLESPNV